jgi:hypothetical protein
MIGDGDCGEIGGMKIGRGSRSTRRNPASAPLCPPQIPHDKYEFLLKYVYAKQEKKIDRWKKIIEIIDRS